MSIKILMPALSPTMKEGILQKWLVKVGDNVKAGDVIAEIETDKATMEVEAVDEGKITDLIIEEGTEAVSVNSVIAILNGNTKDKGEKINKNKTEDISEINNKKKEMQTQKNINTDNNFLTINKSITEKDEVIKASPYTKKLARDKKIDLGSIRGSGPGGRIIKRDFEKLEIQDQKFISSLKYETLEPSTIRKIIAERTAKTINTVPHFYLTIESEVDKLLILRKKINGQHLDNKISINDILVKALALAQKKNPKTNVSWFKDKIYQYSSVDVSIAVALKEGLIMPIIKNADTKGLLEISKEIKILIKRAREGKLLPEEYTGGTISISNLGMFGITEFGAIINPPQSSILAVGTIKKLPRVIQDKILPVNILYSTLSADHRVLDGAVAAQLLKDFNDIIENPFEVWLQSEDMEII